MCDLLFSLVSLLSFQHSRYHIHIKLFGIVNDKFGMILDASDSIILQKKCLVYVINLSLREPNDTIVLGHLTQLGMQCVYQVDGFYDVRHVEFYF